MSVAGTAAGHSTLPVVLTDLIFPFLIMDDIASSWDFFFSCYVLLDPATMNGARKHMRPLQSGLHPA